MPRSIWNGTITFGRLEIPVGIVPTVKDGSTGFRLLHRPCETPITLAKVCAEHGVVPDEELVKGYEVAPGRYVLIEDADLAALTPESDKTIRIRACIMARDLDPLAVERRYYLSASTAPIGRKPYLLLRQALADTNTVALARFVAFGSEWLVTIAPHETSERTLLLSKLSYVDDLVAATEIEKTLAGTAAPTLEELDLASQLVAQLRPLRLRKALLTSDHRERVQRLVEEKLAGTGTVQAKPFIGGSVQEQLPGLDLADALRGSLKKTRGDGPPTRKRRPAAARRRY